MSPMDLSRHRFVVEAPGERSRRLDRRSHRASATFERQDMTPNPSVSISLGLHWVDLKQPPYFRAMIHLSSYFRPSFRAIFSATFEFIFQLLGP